MRRALAVVLISLLLGTLLGSGAGANSREGKSRVLVRAEDAGALRLKVRHRLGDEVSLPATKGTLQLLEKHGVSYRYAEQVMVDPMVSFNPVARRKKGGGDTGFAPVPYGIRMVYGDPHVLSTSGGGGVMVAVLDTGIWMDHPDFVRADGSHVVVDCIDFSQEETDSVVGFCADGHGHGTHVTGTIAATGGSDGAGLWGVAPGASIMAFKVLSDDGVGYSDDIATAIRAAADRGAHIISMSLGSPVSSAEIAEAVRYAADKGVLVVAAAGNGGPGRNSIGYPAALPEVVAVAALDSREQVARFSSRGIDDRNDGSIVEREVEVAAPGEMVLSTFIGGYAIASGTSMAAPHMAGLAAKRWGEADGASAGDVRDWLVAQAKQHDITKGVLAGKGYDAASGYGLPQWNVTRPRNW